MASRRILTATEFFMTKNASQLVVNFSDSDRYAYYRLYDNLIIQTEKHREDCWLIPIINKTKWFKQFALDVRTRETSARNFINDFIESNYIESNFFKFGIVTFKPFLQWNYGLFKRWQLENKGYTKLTIYAKLQYIYDSQIKFFKGHNPFNNFHHFFDELYMIYKANRIDLALTAPLQHPKSMNCFSEYQWKDYNEIRQTASHKELMSKPIYPNLYNYDKIATDDYNEYVVVNFYGKNSKPMSFEKYVHTYKEKIDKLYLKKCQISKNFKNDIKNSNTDM